MIDFVKFLAIGTNTEVFHQVIWAFGPCIQDFQLCRSLINIDAMHLYSRYKDTLMITMGKDENGSINSLAFVIYEGESRSS